MTVTTSPVPPAEPSGMRALIRNEEVLPEPRWTPWVRANLQLLTEYDGWTLVENWEPEPEPDRDGEPRDEGNAYVADATECENATSEPKKSLLDELKELL